MFKGGITPGTTMLLPSNEAAANLPQDLQLPVGWGPGGWAAQCSAAAAQGALRLCSHRAEWRQLPQMLSGQWRQAGGGWDPCTTCRAVNLPALPAHPFAPLAVQAGHARVCHARARP